MNSDFRQRVLVPIALPFGTLLAVVGTAFAFSRVLRTVPSTVATFLALGLASYVLAIGFIVERRPGISSRALAVGVTLGLVAVFGAGVVAAAAGPRPLEEHGAEEGGEGAGAEGAGGAAGGGAVEEVPEGAVVFAADIDFEYTQAPTQIPAGEVTIALELEGAPHNVAFDEVDGGAVVVEGDGSGIFTGTVTLEPGTYTYFCDIAGHRAGGMEGEVTVS